MNADEVNEIMEAIEARYNVLSDVDTPQAQELLQAILAWGDFYWGEFDQWPVNDVAMWEQRLPELQTLIVQAEQGGVLDAPPTSEPLPGPVIVMPEEHITGTWPTWMKVAAGAVLALGLYKVARITKIL